MCYYIVIVCTLYCMEKDYVNTSGVDSMWHMIEVAPKNRNWRCFYRTLQIWSLWTWFHNNLDNIPFKTILLLFTLMQSSPSNFLVTNLAFKIIFHGLSQGDCKSLPQICWPLIGSSDQAGLDSIKKQCVFLYYKMLEYTLLGDMEMSWEVNNKNYNTSEGH